MRNSKVRPILMSKCSNASSDNNSLQLTPALQLDHGGWSLRGHEFWQARRAFLNSYHLNLERSNSNGSGSFKEKLKKSVKEVNEVAMGVVWGMRQGIMCQTRLGIKAFRITMTLPSSHVLVTIRCYMPWLKNKREIV